MHLHPSTQQRNSDSAGLTPAQLELKQDALLSFTEDGNPKRLKEKNTITNGLLVPEGRANGWRES